MQSEIHLEKGNISWDVQCRLVVEKAAAEIGSETTTTKLSIVFNSPRVIKAELQILTRSLTHLDARVEQRRKG
jgi:hypothetical protein